MSELLYRRNTVREALRGSRRKLIKLWVEQDNKQKEIRALMHLAKSRGVPIMPTTKQKLGNMAQDKGHQGVVLETGAYEYAEVEDILAVAKERGERPFILLLDQVHGPKNIGTLLRTAEASGVHGVIMQDRRAPDITPTVAINAVGASEHLHIAKVVNLVQTMNWLQEKEIWLVGMDITEDSEPLDKVDLNIPIGIVVGHEGEGIRRLVADNCDILLKLPMRGHVDSLNASIAGSILMYAAWQARGFEGG